MLSKSRKFLKVAHNLVFVTSKGVSSLLLINLAAMALQFLALKMLAEIDVSGVVIWSAFEFLLGMLLAIGFIGGEHHLINQSSALLGNDSRKNLAATCLLFAAVGMALFVLAWLGMCIFSGLKLRPYFEAAFAALLAGLAFINGVYVRAQSRFLVGALLERGPILFSSILIIAYTALWRGEPIGRLASWCIFFGAVASLVCSLIVVWRDWTFFFERGSLFADAVGIIKSRRARNFSLTNVVVFAYERLDQAIILWLFGAKALAVYFICFRVSFAGRFLSKAINQVYYVLVAKAFSNNSRGSEGKNAHELASIGFKVNSSCAFVLCALGMVFEKQVLGFFFSRQPDTSGILPLLLLSIFLSVKNQAAFSLINARGLSNYYLSNSLIVIGVQAFSIGLMAMPFGVHGVAIARVLAVIVGNVNADRYLASIGESLRSDIWYRVMVSVLCILVIRSMVSIYA